MTEGTDHLHDFYLSQLRHLEERLENQEQRIRQELEDLEGRMTAIANEQRRTANVMTASLQRILDRQAQNEPALNSLQQLMTTSSALKWVILFAVATLAGVNTIATALEALRDWFK